MTVWKAPPGDLSLGADQVHLWRIPLVREASTVEERRDLLSEDELERARSFRFDIHRERFILRRAALRKILGRYLKRAPGEIGFVSSPRGKPEIAAPVDPPTLRFNQSSSEDLALVGVAFDREIGVDVEYRRSIPEMDAIARDHFCAGEFAAFTSVAPAEKSACFYNGWTRKEAWLKARGDGLWVDLDSFEVSLIPGEQPRLLHVDGEPEETRRWRMHAFVPQPGFVGAVAVSGPETRIHHFSFRE